jgi:hypothetical protein
MDLALWLPIAVKALTTALIVITASVAAEALGPVWGAIIACLPVAAGPAYVFLNLRHGADFVVASTLSSAAANAAIGLFLIVHGLLARRYPLWLSLGTAITVWLLTSLAMLPVPWTPAGVVLMNLVVIVPGLLLKRFITQPDQPRTGSPRRRWYELPLRASAVAGFVSVVVTVSSLLGPAATGIAAVFPVSLTSLFVIVAIRLGTPATSRLAFNALAPMLGFLVMLLVLHMGVPALGFALAFGLGLGVTVVWSVILLALYR